MVEKRLIMKKIAFSGFLALSAFALLPVIGSSGCSETGNSSDDIVLFFDSGVPDSTPQPDAEPCTDTVCDGLCVDITTNSLNCGGCGLACDSAGQLCSGALPCSCPEPFVSAQIGGQFDQVNPQGGVIIALSPQIGSPVNVFAVVYDMTLETGVEYNLADAQTTQAPPAVAAGYDVDLTSFTAHTPYGAMAGTIVFDSLCEGGASGTITDVEFAEVLGVTNPVPVADGCTMSYESLSFNIGSCPAGPSPDAGPTTDLDGGTPSAPDAGVDS